MNKFPITKDTFEKYDSDSKLNTIFDLMLVQHEGGCDTEEKLDMLDKKYEHRKKFDSTVSGGMGFIGGAIAVLATRLFGGK